MKLRIKKPEKNWLILSLVSNLGLLAVFKYYNFFAESFATLMSGVGWKVDDVTLNIILPIGISFYTFQNLKLHYRYLQKRFCTYKKHRSLFYIC